jgi:lysophospholipase L1-like esterase
MFAASLLLGLVVVAPAPASTVAASTVAASTVAASTVAASTVAASTVAANQPPQIGEPPPDCGAVHRDYADPSCTTQTRLGVFRLSPHVVHPGQWLVGTISLTCGRGADGKDPCPIDWSWMLMVEASGLGPQGRRPHRGCGTYQTTCEILIPKHAATRPYEIVTVGITNDQGEGISKDYFAIVGGPWYLLSGHVTGTSGEPRDGVPVYISGPTTHRSTTDAAGFYSALLYAGNYSVTPLRDGYSPIESAGCRSVGDSCRVDLHAERVADFGAPPEFSIDVAARYDGTDHNGDHIVDYFPPNDNAVDPPLDPKRWQVTFSIKGDPSTCQANVTYGWAITPESGGTTVRGDGCSFVAELDQPGEFKAKLSVTTGGGAELSTDHNFTIKDILIVSLGDSFGAGEGVPEPTGTGFAWESNRCHTSSQSGFALAAAAVARDTISTDDPTKRIFHRVTFLHLACSGALAATGINAPYDGIDPGGATTPLPSQLTQMQQLLGDRVNHIDAIMLSIGGNDIGFSDIIHACASIPSYDGNNCDSSDGFTTATARFQQRLAALNQQYQRIHDRLASMSSSVDLNSRLVIAEYPDFMHGSDGSACSGPGTFSSTDWTWAYGLLGRLNADIASVAARYGWHVADRQVELFHTHGYCSSDSWMNSITDYATLPSSVGGTSGVFHPNIAGQEAYAEGLTPVLESVLQGDGART